VFAFVVRGHLRARQQGRADHGRADALHDPSRAGCARDRGQSA
jgi:hypothetical protein